MASSAHHTRWIRKEAVMAAAFYTAHRKEHVRDQFSAVVNVLREMLDAFVSNRMRRAAAEAEHVRPRPSQDTRTQSINAQ
jgi:hypothetical protein